MPLFSRVLRYAYSFYAVTDQISTAAKANEDAEFNLKVMKGVTTAAHSMANRDPSRLSFEERLQQAFVTTPLPDSITAHPNVGERAQCAIIMSRMFVRSLGPNGLGIASLPRPTAAELLACGFDGDEEGFLKYFAEVFIERALDRINSSAIDAAQMTLSKKEKEDIIEALDNFQYLTDETAAAIKTPADMVKLLEAEKLKLEKEEGAEFSAKAGSGGGVMGAPRLDIPDPKPGSRRAAIEEALKLNTDHPELFEQRFACMKKMQELAQDSQTFVGGRSQLALMSEKVENVALFNTTFAACNITGDNAQNPIILPNNTTLQDLRSPDPTNTPEEIKLKKAIAEEFDKISTTPDLRNEQINQLDGIAVVANAAGTAGGIAGCGAAANKFTLATCKDTNLRQDIWDNRTKTFNEFVKLLPSEDYVLMLRHTGEIPGALAGATDFAKVIETLTHLGTSYTTAIARGGKPEDIAKKQATLELITDLRNLANAIVAEDAALLAAGINLLPQPAPKDGTVAPTAAQAQEPHNTYAVFTTRNARVQCEAQLAKTAEKHKKRIETKTWNAVYERSAAHNAWEQKRAHSFVTPSDLEQEITVPGVPELSLALDNSASFAGATWTNNTTDLEVFIDTLGTLYSCSPAFIQRLKDEWEDSKYKVWGKATNTVNNANFPAWLQPKLQAELVAIRGRNTPKQAARTAALEVAVANTNIAGSLALPQAQREPKDRPYVAAYVDFANAANNPAGFLVSKEFMIGLNGQQLSLAEARLKWGDLFIHDMGAERYGKGPFPAALTPEQQKRADVGGDLGEGRLSSLLNTLHATYPGLKEIEDRKDGTFTKYIVELDKHPDSPYFTVYRATVNPATGDVSNKEPITMGKWDTTINPGKKTWVPTPEGLAVGKVLSKVYTEGMEASSKLAFETQDKCDEYVEDSFKAKNSGIDVSDSPPKPEEKAKVEKDRYPLLKQHFVNHNPGAAAPGAGAKGVVVTPPTKKTILGDISRAWKNFKPFG